MKQSIMTKPANTHTQSHAAETLKVTEPVNFIKVTCRTDLKGFEKQIWPEIFVSSPQLGDYVKSEVGKVLQIQRIIHCQDFKTNKYYLEIELGKAT